MTAELAALFARDLTRLGQEIKAFPNDGALWETLPGVTNPAGNLVLHLDGNLREYIGRQLGGVPYMRQRDLEFSRKQVPAAELVSRVAELREIIPPIVAALTPEQLATPNTQELRKNGLTVRQFVFSLYGHFNYHLGQIGYLRRALTQGAAVKFVYL